jgi:hypothetical protein
MKAILYKVYLLCNKSFLAQTAQHFEASNRNRTAVQILAPITSKDFEIHFTRDIHQLRLLFASC